jgi:hypothetical protein
MFVLTRMAWLDRLGATMSTVCALHCAAVPFLFLFVPAITLSLRSWSAPHHGLAIALLATLRWERVIVAGVILFAGIVLVLGYMRHRKINAVFAGAVGATFLIAAAIGGVDQPLWFHTTLMVSGGLLVSLAHIMNLHVSRIERDSSTCQRVDGKVPGDW